MGGVPLRAREVLALLVFVVVSVALILLAWVSFGGTLPLQSQGYRVQVAFPSARTLVANADVRISGVPVGKVVAVRAGEDATVATIRLDDRVAPLPRDARAILRTKTPLGESFVQITRGTPSAPKLADGARLPAENVAPTQQIEDVLGVFDARTRRAFRMLLTASAATLHGRGGPDLNAALGATGATAEDLGAVTDALDAQQRDVTTLVDRTGAALAALARRPTELRDLVRAGDEVLDTTATRTRRLTATVRTLGRFVGELRRTTPALQRSLVIARPTLATLRPVTPLLTPALRRLDVLAPELRRLLIDVRPALTSARAGLGPADRLVGAVGSLGTALDATTRQLVPVARLLSAYDRDLVEGFASVASVLAPLKGDTSTRYAREAVTFSTEGLTGFARREPSNRYDPYPAPGTAGSTASYGCSHTSNATLFPPAGPTPACVLAPPWTFDGRTSSFPLLAPYDPADDAREDETP